MTPSLISSPAAFEEIENADDDLDHLDPDVDLGDLRKGDSVTVGPGVGEFANDEARAWEDSPMMTREKSYLAILAVVLLATGPTGCVFGPTSILVGRGVYNEVINRTEDEQLLNMIVRDRYNETYGMLAVASVTASISARADVRAQFGLTRTLKEDIAGNLVPLAGGVAYEENPTISYVPRSGEEFMQRLLSPLSMEEVLLTAQYMPTRRDLHMKIGFRSINGIKNALATEDDTGSATFDRVVQLWQHLRRVGLLGIARKTSGEFDVVFSVDDTEHEKLLEELLELMGISKRPSGGRLVLPVREAAPGGSSEAVNVETRSVLQILRIAGASIEIPETHLKAGVVEPTVDKLDGRFMRIRTSRVRPGGEGTVAVSYRGWWYYVDDADPESKQAFLLLRMLVGIRLHEDGQKQGAPVLTIPVG